MVSLSVFGGVMMNEKGLMQRAEDAALDEPLDRRIFDNNKMVIGTVMDAFFSRPRRHPGDFDSRPSDSQLEYFKRGGR